MNQSDVFSDFESKEILNSTVERLEANHEGFVIAYYTLSQDKI